MAKHYHAGWNMVGYMPDNEPAIFSTIDQAVKYVREAANTEVEDSYYDDAENKLHKRGSNGDYYVGCENPHRLDTHYWVHRCDDDECKVED